jgi:hypothetical protein
MVSRALANWELSEGEGASPLVPRPSADTPGRSAAPSESVGELEAGVAQSPAKTPGGNTRTSERAPVLTEVARRGEPAPASSSLLNPSRCGARYHNGYSIQTCLLPKGHRGRHSDGW